MDPRLPNFVVTEDLESKDFDALVVISPNASSIPFEKVKSPLTSYLAIDASAEKSVFVVPCDLPLKKIVFSGTGELSNDYDDVRDFAVAAKVIQNQAHNESFESMIMTLS